MKKKIISGLLALCLLSCLSVTALAEHTDVNNGSVTYTAGGDLDNNFERAEAAVSSLQPGDDISIVVDLKNENESAANWYITNTVLKSMEESVDASGSAYTYTLTYSGPDGDVTLFDSDTVGGEGSEGLKEAVGSLENFNFMGTLNPGQSATVQLDIALDGETEGNDYFNSLANLAMDFAVEPTEAEEEGEPTPTPAPTNTPAPNETPDPNNGNNQSPAPTATPRPASSVGQVVKTGDEMNLLPFYIAMAVSGILFLVLAVDSVRRRKKEREENT